MHIEQTFGVDLEARARQDRKRVPVIVTTILTFLDNRMYSFILGKHPELMNGYRLPRSRR